MLLMKFNKRQGPFFTTFFLVVLTGISLYLSNSLPGLQSKAEADVSIYTCKSAEPNYAGRKVNPDTAKFAAIVLPTTTASLSQALRYYSIYSNNPAMQQYWAGRVNTLAQSRRDLVIEVVRYDPNLLGSKSALINLSANDQATLAKITSNCYETAVTTEGVLDMAPAGVLTGSSFDVQHYIQTNDKKIIFIYPANRINPELTPNMRVRVSGFRLDSDILFDGNNPDNLMIIVDMRLQSSSPRAVAPRSPVSSQQLMPCSFTRNGVKGYYKSSILLQWMIDAGNGTGVPPAILAGIARHESPTFTMGADDNHDGIVHDNYCNISDQCGSSRCIGLMQLTESEYPNDPNLCTISHNIQLGARHLLKKAPGVSFNNATAVINALCAYNGNVPGCLYGREVWNDYQACNAVDPPPVATVNTTITAIAGVNGGNVTIRGEDSYTVSGSAKATATAVPPQGTVVAGVAFQVDGQQFASDSTPPYEVSADTKALPDGNHILSATGRDNANHTGSDSVTLLVDNTKPTISIAEPPPEKGSGPYSGVVKLRANVGDSTSGIQEVVFILDGVEFDSTTVAPYQVLGDSTLTTNGWHTLTMRVYDNAGNYSSDSRSVLVQNSVDESAPEVAIIEPGNGEHINGYRWFKAKARDLGSGIDRVELAAIRQSTGQLSYLPHQTPEDGGDGWLVFPHNWQAGNDVFPPGTYTLRAKAWDKTSHMSQAEISVTIDPPPDTAIPELIRITQPIGGQFNSDVQVVAEAHDNGSGIDRVEFFVASSTMANQSLGLEGNDNADNWYSSVWHAGSSQYPIGRYALSAKAYDRSGNSAWSNVVYVDKSPPPDTTPPELIRITSPQGGATPQNRVSLNGAVQIVAQAHDQGKGIDRVYFYAGNQLIGSEGNDNIDDWYSAVWYSDNYPRGDYTISAKALDRAGNERWSNAVYALLPQQTVRDTTPPELQIIEPGSGTHYSGWGWFKAKVRDSQSGIDHVELAAIRQSTGQLSYLTPQAPEDAGDGWVIYPHNWHSGSDEFPPDNYTLRAKVWDRANNLSQASVGVTVEPAGGPSMEPDTVVPTLAITSPSNFAFLFRGKSMTLSANAADNRAMKKVEFYLGKTLLCADTIAPYSCSWKVVAPSSGFYSLKAKAYDTSDNVTTRSITVVIF